MSCQSRAVLLALFAIWALVFEASAESQPGGSVILRTYNVAGVPLSVTTVAETTARELLRVAGINAAWRRCRTTAGPRSRSNDPCTDVLQPRELVIRMVNAPRTITDAEALGYSHVDVSVQRGTLATMFTDRIHALASEIKMADGELLGRAIAHEIGHLLLGSTTHSSSGLMRGHWSSRGKELDWQFTGAESAQMRRGLDARTPGDLVVALHQ